MTKEFYHSLSDEEKAHYKVKPLQKFYSVFNLEQTNYSEKFPEEWAKLQQRFQTQLNTRSDGYHNELIDKAITEQSWICPIELKQQDRAFIIERVIASYYQPMNNSLKKNLSILLHSTKWHIVQGTAAG